MQALFENFATERVPETATVGGLRVGLIVGVLAFAIPGLAIGPLIVRGVGFERAILVFVLSGLILAAVGTVTGYIGFRNRLSSYMMIRAVFGPRGAALLNSLLALCLMGWFGINMDFLSATAAQLLSLNFGLSVSPVPIELIAGAGITISTIWGFRLIDRLALWFVLVLAAMTAWLAFCGFSLQRTEALQAPVLAASDMSIGEAMTITIGSFIVSAVLMSDFSRFVRNALDNATASFLPYLVLATLCYLAAALAATATGEADIIKMMMLLGLGNVALVIVVLSSWLTNVVNLYSAALSLSSVLTRVRERYVVVAAGLLCTGVASLDLLNRLTDFLFGLSVVFAPIAGILITDFFLIRKQTLYEVEQHTPAKGFSAAALIAWGCGIAASLLPTSGRVFLSGIEALDGLAIASVIYCAAAWTQREQFTERTRLSADAE
jgi:cytosine permease